ncbi:uncharacterized protein Dvir_GJ26823 [Drosophila virilis]|uniref:Uncharacterized protein n=1 Tax=Drosophila virilis TaxID=7244 RepID=A0A0Q9WIM9_DROVI|nr:uncharacterized protein Dvir_GJ26823 [Drosophila virilis]
MRLALINAYRRRIKRVNSQPLNEHKTQCPLGPQQQHGGADKSNFPMEPYASSKYGSQVRERKIDRCLKQLQEALKVGK